MAIVKSLAPALLVLTTLLCATNVAESRRIKSNSKNTEKQMEPLEPPSPAEKSNESSFVEVTGQAAVVAGELAQAGHVLGGRFVLEHFIESREKAAKAYRHEDTEESTQPGVSFPNARGFENPSHLGQGNFGDVWEAYDQRLKRKVAVKIFYSRASGRKRYLTWNSATSSEKKELEENANECLLVQNALKNAAVYPKGADHICKCYEEHVSKYQGTNEVVYLVLELCGKSLEKIRQDMGRKDSGTVVRNARMITQQVLEALAFLNQLNPPLIHHDMKLDNAVALGGTDNWQVKLIDWGCFVSGSPQNERSQSIGDRRYMPPEFGARQAFKMPAYSFDVYGAGLMHMELACPSLKVDDWFSRWSMSAPKWSTLQRALQKRCPRVPTADLQIIQEFTHADNRRRPDPMVAKDRPIFLSGDAVVSPPAPARPTPAPTPAPRPRPDRSPSPDPWAGPGGFPFQWPMFPGHR